MTRAALRFLVPPVVGGVLFLSAVGCDARPPVTARDGGGDADTPPTSCIAGTAGFRCEGSEAIECNADGTVASRSDCSATSQVCVDGLGCRMCRPSSFRCNGNDVERCNDSGTGYEPHMTCDAGAGRMCNSVIGACTSACDDAAATNSYIGCEYWPVTTSNSQVEPEFLPAVVIANPQSAQVNVMITGPGGFSQSISISPGATQTVELPWVSALKGTTGMEVSAQVAGGAYRVVSNLPVTVYQFNALEYRISRDCAGETDLPDGQCFSYTNDASLLLPTHVLTGNYMVMSRPSMLTRVTDGLGSQTFGSPGFFTIVGVSPTPVTVDIQFRGRVAAGGAIRAFNAGESGSFTLNQGDVLQIVGQLPTSCTPGYTDTIPGGIFGGSTTVDYCTVGSEYDLTGTEIRATGPVQVIAGHNCAFVPYNRWACDHLEEALFPLEAWGTESIISKTQAPMGRTEPNIVRIVSGRDGNAITFDPPSVATGRTLNRGEFMEFEATQSFRVTGSEALMVGQFIVGQDYAGYRASGDMGQGDPAMSLGIPSEQFRTSYTFLAPSSYPTNFVNVTAPSGATVTLDGTQVTGFAPLGGTGMSVAQVSIPSGQHSISSDQPFGIVVYGFGTYTSYVYPGGLDLEAINIPF